MHFLTLLLQEYFACQRLFCSASGTLLRSCCFREGICSWFCMHLRNQSANGTVLCSWMLTGMCSVMHSGGHSGRGCA